MIPQIQMNNIHLGWWFKFLKSFYLVSPLLLWFSARIILSSQTWNWIRYMPRKRMYGNVIMLVWRLKFSSTPFESTRGDWEELFLWALLLYQICEELSTNVLSLALTKVLSFLCFKTIEIWYIVSPLLNVLSWRTCPK